MESKKRIAELRNIIKIFGNETVLKDFNLTINHGEFLTILGPSGCGKTTILRLIAGFEQPVCGDVVIDGEIVNNIPPNKRAVNTVFQNYALFPHLSVYENIAFGLRMEKKDNNYIDKSVKEALALVKLSGYADRKPAQLSGGQQQRVALARAVVKKPLILLLDEPFSALDYKLRKQMQTELKQIQRNLGITFVFVTHDQEEALSMSDRVVVMNQGVVEQIDTPTNVYECPKNLFVAKFIGEANIFDAVVKKATKDKLTMNIEDNLIYSTTIKKGFKVNDHVKLMLRPEDLRISKYKGQKDSASKFIGFIEETNYKGATLDSVIVLESGKKLLASEFFDETHESIDYRRGEKVTVDWVKGWEVILNA